MSISLSFQKRFKSLLEESDYSRSEIAKLIPLSQSTLSNALTYGIIPSTKTLIKIADFFDISINFLLGKTDIEDFYKSSSPASFLSRFESLCSEKEVTHYKVAADCLFDKSNISRWISKGFLPELEILELLCDYFNVSPDYLLGRTEDKD
ncbi:MAG: helix-turn-helix transcriptional regulator [Clostridia bacterium]|nr:helix-turn-helix transcriptional regulator [Clostridia bacterium]